MQRSIESQKSVIALLLRSPELYPEFASLRPEMFVSQPQPFAKIFEAVVTLIKTGNVPSVTSVAEKVALGEDYIRRFEAVAANEPPQTYVTAIINTYDSVLQSQFVQAVRSADDPVAAAKAHLEQYAELVGHKVPGGHITEHMTRYLAHVELVKTLPFETRVMRSPYESLNTAIDGFYVSNYSILFARPGMGKTAFMRGIRDYMIWGLGKHALSFVLEMSPHRLIEREVATRMGISVGEVIKFTFQDNPAKVAEFYAITNKITQGNWYIYGSEINTIEKVIDIIGKHATDDPLLAWVDVDYIQLLGANRSHANRNLEIGQISNELARNASRIWANRIAPQLHIMAAAQASRSVESRDDKRLRLSDLRDSGELEQSADVVMAMYRDDYYYQNSPKPGVAEINILKNRNGPLSNVELNWHGKTMSFDSGGGLC